MAVGTILCLVLAAASGVPYDQPYCSTRYRRLCKGKGLHVGCQFPDAGPGPSCSNYSPVKFQDNLKHFITHFINRRRQRIAAGAERVRGGVHLPKPEVMMLVEWDRELAILAQRLADQCAFVHDDCRATVRFPYAGQTVGEVRWRRTGASDGLAARRAVRRIFDAWWGERRRVTPHQLAAPFRLTAKGAVWGHFSQLAVWSLRAVGCGAARHGVTAPRLLLVCDFSHTNMLGQRTLTPGPMGLCPDHTARRPRSSYSLLCAPVRHPTKTEHYEIEAEKDSYDEEEEEIDDGDATAVDFEENQTSYVKILQATPPNKWKPSGRTIVDENSEYIFQAMPRKKTTKAVFQDKELEIRKKVQSKNQIQNNDVVLWHPMAPEYGRKQSTVYIEEETLSIVKEGWRRITTVRDRQDVMGLPAEISALPYVPRQKWHQTRDRPNRPGASALLNVPTAVHTRRRRPVASLMLDKEDIEQLFRDTGFNPNWRRQHDNP